MFSIADDGYEKCSRGGWPDVRTLLNKYVLSRSAPFWVARYGRMDSKIASPKKLQRHGTAATGEEVFNFKGSTKQ
jgi:hypothetical protein